MLPRTLLLSPTCWTGPPSSGGLPAPSSHPVSPMWPRLGWPIRQGLAQMLPLPLPLPVGCLLPGSCQGFWHLGQSNFTKLDVVQSKWLHLAVL